MHIEKLRSENDTSTVIDCALCVFDLKKKLCMNMVRVTVLNYCEKGEAEEQTTRKVSRTTTTSARPTSGRPTARITPQILLQTITHSRRTHART